MAYAEQKLHNSYRTAPIITITMSRNKYITKIISVLHRTGKTSA